MTTAIEHDEKDVRVDDEAMAIMVGKAYADAGLRTSLTLEPSMILAEQGVLPNGEESIVVVDRDIDAWTHVIEVCDGLVVVRMGIPDVDPDLQPTNDWGVTLCCCPCCCCP